MAVAIRSQDALPGVIVMGHGNDELGSVVLYALLIIIDNRIPDSAVDNTVVSEAQSQQRRLS